MENDIMTQQLKTELTPATPEALANLDKLPDSAPRTSNERFVWRECCKYLARCKKLNSSKACKAKRTHNRVECWTSSRCTRSKGGVIMTTSENAKNKGLAALTTTPQETKRKARFTDNSAYSQRAKLLDYFNEHGSITTAEARGLLGIMSPAARIIELKARGYLIESLWADWIDKHGIKHRIAHYVLRQKQPNASEV